MKQLNTIPIENFLENFKDNYNKELNNYIIKIGETEKELQDRIQIGMRNYIDDIVFDLLSLLEKNILDCINLIIWIISGIQILIKIKK